MELRSSSDRLQPIQEKLQEYTENGAQLGWLLDPLNRQVEIYRAGFAVEVLNDPTQLSGEALLPGFQLDLHRVWQ